MADESRVRVAPLGGLGEIGMNCMVLEQGGRSIVVDCGVTFDERALGIDVVHPDFSFLDHTSLAAVVLTHGHEDHIGALPYLLRRHDVPVYGPAYALALVRERLAEHEVLSHARLFEVKTRKPYRAGPFEIEPIRVTHSTADATALAIRTASGTIVHSGDFKFDEAPPDGELFDEERLRQIGDEGVSLLFSDSTNVETEGSAGSESGVAHALGDLVRGAKGAVVVGLFASNVHRLRILGDIARSTGRRLVLLGRSVGTHSRVARATGYLGWPGDLVWPVERVRELPRAAVLAIATGTQAEENAALSKLARGEHPHLLLTSGDMVIFSSRVIPGNEPEVYGLMSALVRQGVDLRTRSTDRGIHVSGHAHRGEQRRMLELVRPRSFIPVHGTRVHLARHAALAREAGVADVRVLENGDTAWLSEHGLEAGDSVPSGRVHVFAQRAVSDAVMSSRRSLAESGVVSCVLLVDQAFRLAAPPQITTLGVCDDEVASGLARSAASEITRALDSALPPFDEARVSDTARYALRRVFGKALGRKPIPVVQVVKVRPTG